MGHTLILNREKWHFKVRRSYLCFEVKKDCFQWAALKGFTEHTLTSCNENEHNTTAIYSYINLIYIRLRQGFKENEQQEVRMT